MKLRWIGFIATIFVAWIVEMMWLPHFWFFRVLIILFRKRQLRKSLLSLADIQGMRFNMVVHHEYFHLLVKFFHWFQTRISNDRDRATLMASLLLLVDWLYVTIWKESRFSFLHSSSPLNRNFGLDSQPPLFWEMSPRSFMRTIYVKCQTSYFRSLTAERFIQSDKFAYFKIFINRLQFSSR